MKRPAETELRQGRAAIMDESSGCGYRRDSPCRRVTICGRVRSAASYRAAADRRVMRIPHDLAGEATAATDQMLKESGSWPSSTGASAVTSGTLDLRRG